MSKNSRLNQLLENQFCLVVEPSASFAFNIQACLKALGIPPTRILMARKLDDARKLIETNKPRMLITEYQIDGSSGLELIDLQEKVYSGPFKLAFIATQNTADSTVAEAAEEQVDGFMVKPLSADDFNKTVNEALDRKSNPSPYLAAIAEGKKLLEAKQFPQAAEKFLAAKPQNPKPSLACYYAGQAFLQSGGRTKALAEFQEGLKHQEIHYRCLTGAFEAFIAEKNFDEAFALIGRLKEHYPVTPRRLSQIFVVCILSRHFDDVKTYYEKYQALDIRTPELTKVASMALFTAAKHYLESKKNAEAMEMLEFSAITVARNFEFMEKGLGELIKYQAYPEAQTFLSKFSLPDRSTPPYRRLAFKVEAAVLPKDQVAEKGRQLIITGIGTPEIYEQVVRALIEVGKILQAEEIILRAGAEYPKIHANLTQILKSGASSPKPV